MHHAFLALLAGFAAMAGLVLAASTMSFFDSPADPCLPGGNAAVVAQLCGTSRLSLAAFWWSRLAYQFHR
jgi:hypothetical protein